MDITLAILITLFLTVPLLTFFHELGHALAGLSVGASQVSIQLGSQPPSKKAVLVLNFERIRFTLANWTPFGVGFAKMDSSSEIAPRQRALVAIAGPLTSLIMVILLSIVAFLTRKDPSLLVRAVVQQAALGAFIQLIMTSIPMRYPKWMGAYGGHNSDMARAVKHLQKEQE